MPTGDSHFRTPLLVPYERPTQLSDPCHDFTPEITRAILARRDEEFTWYEFQNILGPFLPAGAYAEGAYFLPLALDYIATHDDDALELVTSIVWFVSEHTDRLAADGLLEGARGRMVELFQLWTSRFTVVHYDQAGCREKGWGCQYFDYVKLEETVCQGLCDLVRFARHVDLADELVRELAHHAGDPFKAAWFLQLVRARNEVYRPPRRKSIQLMLADAALIRSAVDVVKATLATTEPSPTFWRDAIWELVYE